MDSKIIELVKKWFDKTENWQKDAFVNLWKGADFEAVKSRAYKLALKEHNIESSSLAWDTSFPRDISKNGENLTNTALVEISDVKGVCALAPTKPLKFGLGLNIVYGENGCGKSSYVRILKKAQDPKSSISIYGNIYSDKEKTTPSANLTFDYDGSLKKESWSSLGKKSYPIRIYDTQIAKHFVEDKNEVIYEPKLLLVFSEIAKIIEYVKAQVEDQILTQAAILKKPPELINTSSKIKEYNNLNSISDLADFRKDLIFTNKNTNELESLTIALKESNPQGTIKQLLSQKTYLFSLSESIKECIVKLDDSFIDKFKKQRKAQIDTKAAYDRFILESRGISIFKGLGSDEWNALWKSSIDYIDYVSKIDNESRNNAQNYCVLCQQKLSSEAEIRKSSLNKFYTSTLKTEYDHAAEDFNEIIQTISELLELLNKSKIRLSLESNAISEDVSNQVLEVVDVLYNRAKWIYEYDESSKSTPKNVDIKKIGKFFDGIFNNIETQTETLNKIVSDYDSQKSKHMELTAKKWLCDNISNLDIKAKVFALRGLLSKTTTNMVTTLKKNLSQIMITGAYVERFKDELDMISSNHNINVELVPGAAKGKVYHKVALVGAVEKRNTEEILSEGEYRAVSIAAFLADLSAWNVNQAFIFDDPINSLDQNYEENIAKRLVLLAGERQVIVFTHRLAFAEMLNRLAQSKNNAAKAKGIAKININYVKLVRNPLGDPDYQNDFANSKLDSKLNNLDAPIRNAEKAQAEGDHSTADMLLKGLCSTLRDIVEKSIETTLLNSIVSRYGQNVSSEKIRYLKAITETDIDFIDGMMTKYSKFDHSHSDEVPVPLPTIDEFKTDVNAIKDWYVSFKSQLRKYDKK